MTLPVASTSGLHWFHDFCWAPIPELCMTKPWIAGTFVMENKQHYSLFHQNHPDRTCFVLFPWKLHLHWPRWQHSPKLWARKGWNQPQHLHFPWLSTDQMRSFSHWISEGKPGNHPFWTYQYINEKTTNDRTIRPFLWQLLTFWLLLRLASDVALDGLSSKWLNLQTGYFNILVGGFNSLEKIISQWEGLSHILWKTTNVSNHKPEYRNINVPFMHGFVRTTCAKSTNSPLNRI